MITKPFPFNQTNKTCTNYIAFNSFSFLQTKMHKFVQPLLPNFLHSFIIPKSFMKHLESDLKGDHLQTVVLMTDYQPRRHWVITVEKDRLFTDCWQEFCQYHDFQIGHFLVFTHQSNLMFHVSVYEPRTACQRSFSSCDHPKSVPKTKGLKRTSADLDYTCETEPNESEDDREAAIPSTKDESRCVINLASYAVEKGILFLPAGFMRKNGLQSRRGEVFIEDTEKRVWPARLNHNKRGYQSYICGGWKSFVEANRFKPGNVLSLQLFKGGNCLTFKFCRMFILKSAVPKSKGSKRIRVDLDPSCETEPNESEDIEESAIPSTQENSGCLVILTSAKVENGTLFLPAGFVRKIGLQFRTCGVLIEDAKKRVWPANLSCIKSHDQSYINQGWKSFVKANHLRPGNVLSLQLLKGGNCPIFKCCLSERTRVDLNSTRKTKPAQSEAEGEVAIPSIQDDSRCVVNLTSYGFLKGLLNLPVGFARKNGLLFRRGKVLIEDSKKRVWPARINYKKSYNQSYINQGWKSFLTANHLKLGHALSFQVLKGGSCPIIKCCRRVKSGVELNSACKTTVKKTQAKGVVSLSDQDTSKYPRCQVKLCTYAIKDSYICVSARFVRKCGLEHRQYDVKVVDEKERAWQVSLNVRSSGAAYICRGWSDVRTANCFGLGDTICFRLLEAGERPALKCYKK